MNTPIRAAYCFRLAFSFNRKIEKTTAANGDSLFKIEASAQRVANFLNCSLAELKTYARITGHKNLHDLNAGDLCTINREISDYTNIPHA